MASSRAFTARHLRAKAEELRAIFLEDGTATATDLDPYWPGGDENRLTGQDAWILAYGRCLWCLGRAIGKEQALAARTPAQDLEKLKMLHSAPEVVTLVSEDAEGSVRSVTVYPKSGLALEHISAATLISAHLADQIALLEEHAAPEDLELLNETRATQQYFQRLCCWIATHPGPGLPYPRGVKMPELPETIDGLNPIDYYLIAQGCMRVNQERLRALDRAESTDERPDWPGFYVGAGAELHEAVSLLYEGRPLAEVATTVHERNRLHEEARAKAKEAKGAVTLPGDT